MKPDDPQFQVVSIVATFKIDSLGQLLGRPLRAGDRYNVVINGKYYPGQLVRVCFADASSGKMELKLVKSLLEPLLGNEAFELREGPHVYAECTAESVVEEDQF